MSVPFLFLGGVAGGTYDVTVQRQTTSLWFRPGTGAYESNPTYAQRKISLAEGTAEYAGQFAAVVANLGSPGKVSWFVHYTDDFGTSVVAGGECLVQANSVVDAADAASIGAAVAAILAGAAPTVRTPLSATGGTLTLQPGKGYGNGHSPIPPWACPCPQFEDLTGATVVLRIGQKGGRRRYLEVECEFSGAATADQEVTVELTAEQTALLPPLTTLEYEIVPTWGADVPADPREFIAGTCKTLNEWTET